MPPFELSAGQKAILGQWGALVGAANEGLGTQAIYSALYNARVSAGLDPGAIQLRDLNPLRSMATKWRTGPQAIDRAPGSTPLSDEHIALAPWSRDQYTRNAQPLFEVRYEYLTDPALPAGEQWVTIPAEAAGMPATIGELRSMVEQHANELAASGSCPPTEEDQDFTGVGKILVIAV